MPAGYRLRLYTNLARIYDRLAALRAFGEFSSFAKCGLEEHAPMVTDLTRDAMTTTQDNMPHMKRLWGGITHEFDATYAGKKSPVDVGFRFRDCFRDRSSRLQMIRSIATGPLLSARPRSGTVHASTRNVSATSTAV